MSATRATCGRLLGVNIAVKEPLELQMSPPTGDADVVVAYAVDTIDQSLPRGGVIIGHLSAQGRQLYTLFEDGDGWLLRVHGLCDFEIGPLGALVVCRPTAHCRPELASVLIGGLLLATILTVRGGFVLHGSAVDTPRGAVAFVGPTGTGKSTLAALCCAAGARLIADDVLSTRCDAAQVIIDGWSPELRLRSGAHGIADEMDISSTRRTTVDGRLAIGPAPSSQGPVALRAILLPRPSREIRTVRLERLSAAAATFELLRNPRVAAVDPALRARQFEQSTRVASVVGVHVAHVPWGPPFTPGIAEALLFVGDER